MIFAGLTVCFALLAASVVLYMQNDIMLSLTVLVSGIVMFIAVKGYYSVRTRRVRNHKQQSGNGQVHSEQQEKKKSKFDCGDCLDAGDCVTDLVPKKGLDCDCSD